MSDEVTSYGLSGKEAKEWISALLNHRSFCLEGEVYQTCSGCYDVATPENENDLATVLAQLTGQKIKIRIEVINEHGRN